MKTDEQIEDEAIDLWLDENLDPDSQMYLMDVIDNDPRLEQIIETIIIRGVEVSAEGQIEGPGTGKSDSIPARLSDGEFVFSAEAVQVIGVENLEELHNQAKAQAASAQTSTV